MRFTGGYNVLLQGRPSGLVDPLPEPDRLHLPLRSRRFGFSELVVEEGQRVEPGEALAKDPDNFGLPLIAPREGTVRLQAAEGHITLEDITKVPEEAYHPDEALAHVPKRLGSAGMARYKLLVLGAWQFFQDACTGALPDPFGPVGAIIVSTVNLESFAARGDAQLHKRLSHFTRGLEQLQGLLEYQPIYLALPDVRSAFAQQVRETLRGYAFVNTALVPRTYPYHFPRVLVRAMGLEYNPNAPVWAVDTPGVLAVDRALTLSRPSTVRIIAAGGPAIAEPRHLKAIPGYPLEDLASHLAPVEPFRMINGGVLTGDAVGASQKGLDVECAGLTFLPEHRHREFLGFTRPGADRASYSRCFLSVLRPGFAERLTSALRGEARPCISCRFCEEVCPAGIMPHLIHKCAYRDALEEADEARADLCVACGLCSFVCPSKIELRKQIGEVQERIREEMPAGEATA